MALNAIRGPGLNLPLFPLTPGPNIVPLAPGQYYVLPPGNYIIGPGPYSFIQTKDPITGIWRMYGTAGQVAKSIYSDGQNMRVANLTGFALGAQITNNGANYTSAPTVTASAGGSTWTAIVGGAVGTITVGTPGAGYTYTPTVVFSAPPAGGIPATGYATLSGGTLSSVTLVNSGAGYTTAPTITIVPDSRDVSSGSVTTTALATCVLTGTNTITGLLCTSHGTTAVTSVPTLSFSGGGGSGAAATTVMCFSLTGLGTVTGGAGYGNAQPFGFIAVGGQTAAGSPTTSNPGYGYAIMQPRLAVGSGTSTAGGAIQAAGFLFTDSGMFSAVPNGIILSGAAIPTTIGSGTLAVGGVTDYALVQPI